MKAMIFAAGLGTRMKPFTDSAPKALVKVGNMTLLEILIRQMKRQGISQIIVNVHHLASQIIDFLRYNDNFGAEITISDESKMLLDTGGGLMKAAGFFDDGAPFAVQNVDVICDINYADVRKQLIDNKALATVAVSCRQSSRYLLFDEAMQLCGWENTITGERKIVRHSNTQLNRFAFSGIHVIDPRIFSSVTLKGKFSMIDLYLRLAAEHRITGMEHSARNWVDVGKPESLEKAESVLLEIEKTYDAGNFTHII